MFTEDEKRHANVIIKMCFGCGYMLLLELWLKIKPKPAHPYTHRLDV